MAPEFFSSIEVPVCIFKSHLLLGWYPHPQPFQCPCFFPYLIHSHPLPNHPSPLNVPVMPHFFGKWGLSARGGACGGQRLLVLGHHCLA